MNRTPTSTQTVMSPSWVSHNCLTLLWLQTNSNKRAKFYKQFQSKTTKQCGRCQLLNVQTEIKFIPKNFKKLKSWMENLWELRARKTTGLSVSTLNQCSIGTKRRKRARNRRKAMRESSLIRKKLLSRLPLH